MIVTRQTAIDQYNCSKCGALKGERCLNGKGLPRASVHAQRWAQAERLMQAAGRDTSVQWWWVVGRGGSCESCGQALKGLMIAYRHVDQAKRCEMCADAEGLAPARSRKLRA